MKEDQYFNARRDEVKQHFNSLAGEYGYWKRKNSYYFKLLKDLFREIVPNGKSVLEMGCGTGDVLVCLEPIYGVGVDVSEGMVNAAKTKHPKMDFFVGAAESIKLDEQFDYVVMADLIDHLVDVQGTLKNVRPMIKWGGRLVISTINPLWSPILLISEKLGLKMPEGYHNFVLKDDICNILRLEDYEVVDSGYRILIPKYFPLLSDFINKFAPRIKFIREFCLCQYIVATPSSAPRGESPDISLSIVIPCYNEEDNIMACVARIPRITLSQEVVLVNDGSTDGTERAIMGLRSDNPRYIKVVSYHNNQGKGHAVKKGFEAANGEVLMILDADMSLMPEELPRFYEAIKNKKGDFINGTRMMYPMEDESMRLLNLIGNNIFSRALSLLVGQRLTDTLCGTKCLFKSDFKKMMMGRDRWGDFDLLFGAAKLKLRIVEVPVHYQRRDWGESKMLPLKHGFQLFMVCLVFLFELKLRLQWDRIKRRGVEDT
ncbi:MAG: glycosyltransferase [Candidatus Altiarchaeota archaeon]